MMKKLGLNIAMLLAFCLISIESTAQSEQQPSTYNSLEEIEQAEKAIYKDLNTTDDLLSQLKQEMHEKKEKGEDVSVLKARIVKLEQTKSNQVAQVREKVEALEIRRKEIIENKGLKDY